MSYRIAFGGIHTESSTFNPVLTETKDFQVLRGDALRGERPLPLFRGLHGRRVFTDAPRAGASRRAGGSSNLPDFQN